MNVLPEPGGAAPELHLSSSEPGARGHQAESGPRCGLATLLQESLWGLLGTGAPSVGATAP